MARGIFIQAQGSERHKIHPSPPQWPGSHHKSQEITPSPIQGSTLHWCQDRCAQGTHLSSTSTNKEDPHRHPEVPSRLLSVSQTRPTSSRADVINHLCSCTCSTKTQIPANLAPVPLQSPSRSPTEKTSGVTRTDTTTTVVDIHATSPSRSPISPSATHGSGHHRCEPHGLGSPLWLSSRSCTVVFSGKATSHQSPRDFSSNEGTKSLLSPSTWPWCSNSHRQHHGHVLHKQARGNTFSVPAFPHGNSLGMVLPEPHISSGGSSFHRGQLSCRPTQSPPRPDARVGVGCVCIPSTMSTLGHTCYRSLCHSTEHEVPSVCIQSGRRPQFARGCLHAVLEARSAVCVPSIPTSTEDVGTTPTPVSGGHTSDSLLASAAMVSNPGRHGGGFGAASQLSSTHHTGCGHGVSSRPPHSPSYSVEDIPEVKEVLDRSKKPSTSTLYSYKWKSFLKFTESRGLLPVPASLSTTLQFLRYLFDLKLSVATLRVYLAAVVSFQPKDSPSSRLFSHPTVKAFFKGLNHLRPPLKPLVPQWSLNLVLNALMAPPFEPLATCSLKLLSLKVLFLVAITSARRASELAALRVDQPFLQFFNDKVILHTDVSFLPKVVSEFHLNQPLILPTFFSQPSNTTERMLHSLDVKRALSFYVARTKDFRLSPRLFLCYFGHKKGLPASPPSISRWLVTAISLAYELQHKSPPEGLRAHSTRAVASSTALLRGVDLPDICRTATWSTVSTFISHYRLDVRAKRETQFGRAVLASALQ